MQSFEKARMQRLPPTLLAGKAASGRCRRDGPLVSGFLSGMPAAVRWWSLKRAWS